MNKLKGVFIVVFALYLGGCSAKASQVFYLHEMDYSQVAGKENLAVSLAVKTSESWFSDEHDAANDIEDALIASVEESPNFSLEKKTYDLKAFVSVDYFGGLKSLGTTGKDGTSNAMNAASLSVAATGNLGGGLLVGYIGDAVNGIRELKNSMSDNPVYYLKYSVLIAEGEDDSRRNYWYRDYVSCQAPGLDEDDAMKVLTKEVANKIFLIFNGTTPEKGNAVAIEKG